MENATNELINTLKGKDLAEFMARQKHIKETGDGINKALARTYFHLATERAVELNKGRFGNWYEAKAMLDRLPEPKVTATEAGQRHWEVRQPDVLGYLCFYAKHRTDEGTVSHLALLNGTTNSVYLKPFNEVSYKQAVDIFN